MKDSNVICIESTAFKLLVDKLYDYVKEKHAIEHDLWISGDEAMRKLNITSKTSLQNLRDTGQIRFSQPMHKVIVYDRQSINEYLEKHAKNTF